MSDEPIPTITAEQELAEAAGHAELDRDMTAYMRGMARGGGQLGLYSMGVSRKSGSNVVRSCGKGRGGGQQ